MIAFFVPSLEQATAISRHLSSATRETDGPFRLYKGRLRGRNVSCFVTTEGADGAWAAARLAIHRGARTLVPITRAFTDAHLAEEHQTPLGSMLHIGTVWNYAGILPLLRLLPDSATRLPLELEPLLPGEPVHRAPEKGMPTLATLPQPVSNGVFLRHLASNQGIDFFDLTMAGFAEAMEDVSNEEFQFSPVSILQGITTERGMEHPSVLVLDRAFEHALTELMAT